MYHGFDKDTDKIDYLISIYIKTDLFGLVIKSTGF